MKMFDHRRTRSRRANDRLGVRIFEDLDEPLGELVRLFAITRIKSRLAATRLALVKDNVTSRTPQNLDRGHADVRTKLVDETCYKKRDFQIVL